MRARRSGFVDDIKKGMEQMHTRLVTRMLGMVGLALATTSVTLAHADDPKGNVVITPGLVDKGPGIEKFYKIRTPGAATIANDGSLYVRDWPDGVFQLYRVEGAKGDKAVATPKSAMQKLSAFKDGLAGYSLSQDGTKMLTFAAAGGNEKTQVYLLDTTNPDPATNMTPVLFNPEVVFGVNLWLHNSAGFVYTANDKSANDFYIYRYDFAAPGTKDKDGKPVLGTSTALLQKPGSWGAGDITRDGARALVGEYRSASDASMQELDTKTGALKDLGAMVLTSGTTAALSAVGYMPDEKGVLFESDHESDGIKRLYLLDTTTGKAVKPIAALEKYELDGAGTNEERTLLTTVTNEDGYGVLRIFRLPSFEPVPLPQMEKGLVGISSLRGNRLIYTLNNARTPGLAFEYMIPQQGQPAGTPRQVTFADEQGIDLAKLPLQQLITYKSFDGKEIPAFLTLPANYVKGTPIPFIVDYHGGPEGQHRPGFDRQTQYLVSEGFGVLQPNVRGSSGYGRAFLMMDDYKNRWLSVRDGVYAAQWLVDQGYAKPGKIAAYGGSYGGFMATATPVEDTLRVERGEVKTPLLGASINVVGVVNLRTFLEKTSGYRRKLREVEYGPLTDPEFLDSVSPLLKADKINVPMMIAHGLNDPRVPVGEAMQLAEALQRRGYDPEQVYFHDEGHGFAKLDNRLLFAQRMSRFLKRTIGQ
jgi:dienelactone hydrolase